MLLRGCCSTTRIAASAAGRWPGSCEPIGAGGSSRSRSARSRRTLFSPTCPRMSAPPRGTWRRPTGGAGRPAMPRRRCCDSSPEDGCRRSWSAQRPSWPTAPTDGSLTTARRSASWSPSAQRTAPTGW